VHGHCIAKKTTTLKRVGLTSPKQACYYGNRAGGSGTIANFSTAVRVQQNDATKMQSPMTGCYFYEVKPNAFSGGLAIF